MAFVFFFRSLFSSLASILVVGAGEESLCLAKLNKLHFPIQN